MGGVCVTGGGAVSRRASQGHERLGACAWGGREGACWGEGACAETTRPAPGQRRAAPSRLLPRPAAHQLIRQHQHRLEAELSIAKVEQVLEAGPQQVYDHDVVVPFHAVPPDVGDAHCAGAGPRAGGERGALSAPKVTCRRVTHPTAPAAPLLTAALQDLVQLGLVQELCMSRLDRLLRRPAGAGVQTTLTHTHKQDTRHTTRQAAHGTRALSRSGTHQLDGHLLAGLDVGAQVDVPKRAAANLAPQAVPARQEPEPPPLVSTTRVAVRRAGRGAAPTLRPSSRHGLQEIRRRAAGMIRPAGRRGVTYCACTSQQPPAEKGRLQDAGATQEAALCKGWLPRAAAAPSPCGSLLQSHLPAILMSSAMFSPPLRAGRCHTSSRSRAGAAGAPLALKDSRPRGPPRHELQGGAVPVLGRGSRLRGIRPPCAARQPQWTQHASRRPARGYDTRRERGPSSSGGKKADAEERRAKKGNRVVPPQERGEGQSSNVSWQKCWECAA